MSIATSNTSMRASLSYTPERFHANKASIQGTIYKIWPSPDENDRTIFARVQADPENPEEQQGHPARITLAFLNGQIAGRPFNLLRGEHIQINGYLIDLERPETLETFLTKCRRRDLINAHPELATIAAASVKRSLTCLVPTEKDNLDGLPEAEFKDLTWEQPNTAFLEGVVISTWDYAQHKFLRLAVYDRYTAILQEKGLRPRRKPHYVTIQLTEGKIGEIPIEWIGKRAKPRPNAIRVGDRIGIQGQFTQQPQWDNLRSFIIRARQAAVLAKLPDTDRYSDIRFSAPMTVVEALWFLQYT